jgi:hypothetical protein
LAQAADSIAAGGMRFRLEINARARSLGRSSVTVPSGAYTDVYGMRLIVEINLETIAGPVSFSQARSQTMEAYLKDGVGVVRQTETEIVEESGHPTTTSTSTALLRRYYLMRSTAATPRSAEGWW